MSRAEDIAKAFGDKCSCGYQRFIILRGPFKWRWCDYCDGKPMPKAVLGNEADE